MRYNSINLDSFDDPAAGAAAENATSFSLLLSTTLVATSCQSVAIFVLEDGAFQLVSASDPTLFDRLQLLPGEAKARASKRAFAIAPPRS